MSPENAWQDKAIGLLPRLSAFSISEARLLSHFALLCGLPKPDQSVLVTPQEKLLGSWFPWYAEVMGESEEEVPKEVLSDLFFLGKRLHFSGLK